MDWIQLINFWNEDRSVAFAPPASEEELIAAESALGMKMPADLRELLSQSNGVSLGKFGGWIYDTDSMVAYNINPGNYKYGVLSQEHFLHFGSPGVDGIQLAYNLLGDQTSAARIFAYYRIGTRGEAGFDFVLKMLDEETSGADIFAWGPILDELQWVAPSLQTFMEQWSKGQISV